MGDHGTTYGGNPLASTVGSYIVDHIGDKEFFATSGKQITNFP